MAAVSLTLLALCITGTIAQNYRVEFELANLETSGKQGNGRPCDNPKKSGSRKGNTACDPMISAYMDLNTPDASWPGSNPKVDSWVTVFSARDDNSPKIGKIISKNLCGATSRSRFPGATLRVNVRDNDGGSSVQQIEQFDCRTSGSSFDSRNRFKRQGSRRNPDSFSSSGASDADTSSSRNRNNAFESSVNDGFGSGSSSRDRPSGFGSSDQDRPSGSGSTNRDRSSGAALADNDRSGFSSGSRSRLSGSGSNRDRDSNISDRDRDSSIGNRDRDSSIGNRDRDSGSGSRDSMTSGGSDWSGQMQCTPKLFTAGHSLTYRWRAVPISASQCGQRDSK